MLHKHLEYNFFLTSWIHGILMIRAEVFDTLKIILAHKNQIKCIQARRLI